MLPPGRPALLLSGQPVKDSLPPEADVPAELEMRDQAGAGVLRDPSLRDVEHLGDVRRVEEPIRHPAPFSENDGSGLERTGATRLHGLDESNVP